MYAGISVEVIPNYDSPPLAGKTDVCLSCKVNGIDKLNLTSIIYQWKKNDTDIPHAEQKDLSLSPLKLSDAGTYTCQVTIVSASFQKSLPAESCKHCDVKIKSNYYY